MFNWLNHNFLLNNEPRILVRPALGYALDPRFTKTNYKSLIKSVTNPLDILALRTEGLSEFTFNNMEIGPIMVPLTYDVFQKNIFHRIYL